MARKKKLNLITVDENDPNISYIHIDSPKYGHFECLIDTDDIDKVKNYSWHVDLHRKTFYCKTNIPNSEGTRRQKPLKLHRLIINASDREHVDHINSDGLDNRKSNIRICNHQQNHYNRKSNSNSTSRHKGVSWNKDCKKWHAQVSKNGKKYYLGLYLTEIEAARAYDAKALELHGKFAYLNFPKKIASKS